MKLCGMIWRLEGLNNTSKSDLLRGACCVTCRIHLRALKAVLTGKSYCILMGLIKACLGASEVVDHW